MNNMLLLSLLLLLSWPTCVDATIADPSLPQHAVTMLSGSHQVNHRSDKPSEDAEAKGMRFKAIAIESFSWGVQEGAYYRTAQIQSLLDDNSFTLNKVASFSKFIIDGDILMPTILAAEQIYVKTSDRETRTVNTSYTFDKSPRFVSQPPTWRDYLKRTMPNPKRPINQAHPRTGQEIDVWDIEFKKGWLQGVSQAESIYSSDLNRLFSYLAGLYRFRFLLAQNIVTLPTIGKDKKGLMLLDSGKTINLNDVKYTITLDPTFRAITDWQPVFNRGAAHE